MQQQHSLKTEHTIYPASEKDAEQIGKLAQQIWPVCFAGILSDKQIANILGALYSPQSLRAQMQDGHRFWIAYAEERPVGFVSTYKEASTIWLKKIYLIAELQGKGLGTKLLHTATSAFLPADEIRLLVNRDNLSAQAFYIRLGFQKVGEIPVKMGDFPFVDYIFSKPISS
jgi:ribosomal protein S18 acetylase RimI-like enzyme